MKSTDDITPIDELIAQVCRVSHDDDTERVQLATARRQLDRVLDEAANNPPAPNIERRRRRRSPASLPVLVSSLVVVLIAVVALIVIRPRPATPGGSSPGPAGANALIAKLAVLRRPQTSADRLPGHLEINWVTNGAIGPQVGVIIPSLTRLVASPSGAKLYLVVTTPVGGHETLWSASLGDQVTILAITARGATEMPGYPAADLSNGTQLVRAGLDLAGRPLAELRDAYDVAIVPDGVARVRWTFADRAGDPGRTVTAAVSNNVAITHLGVSTAFVLRATWYAADGSVVPTSDAALAAAMSARTNARRQAALRQAERQHVTVPAALLDAFAVFSFNSPTGSRTSSGYVISRPPLSALPLFILQGPGAGGGQDDLRQARHVVAPSGLDMWAVPGANGLCVWAMDRGKGPYGRVLNGGGGSCSANIRQAESEGSGFSSTGPHGSIIYGIVPKTTHTVAIQTGAHTHRTIQPVDGVYIATTPFKFG